MKDWAEMLTEVMRLIGCDSGLEGRHTQQGSVGMEYMELM